MYLWFRFILTMVRASFRAKIESNASSVVKMRVLRQQAQA